MNQAELEPVAPVLMFFRFDTTFLDQMGFDVATPEELLIQMDIDGEAEAYDLAAYPAARGSITSDGSDGMIYVLLLPDNSLVMLALVVPFSYNADYLDEVITQPVVRSLEVLVVEGTPTPLPTVPPTLTPTFTATTRPTLLPTWTPMPTYTPTATATPLDVSTIELEPYTSEPLGLSFDAPVGWIPVSRDEVDFPVVLFYVSPVDAEYGEVNDPSAPALGIARLTGDEFGEETQTPEEFLEQGMGVEPDSITTFTGLDYPTARGLADNDYSEPTIGYVIQVAENDWILVILITPGIEEQLMLLDEVVAQPLVRSIKVISPTATP